MSSVKIHTDGGNLFPGGPGGYAVVVSPFEDISISDKTIFFSGGHSSTTNNRMELMGVLEALRWVKTQGKTNIIIYSDSQYSVKGANFWMHTWVRTNWKNGQVKNIDLWKQIYGLYCELKCRLEWVKGHNGDVFNEFCDSLANKAMEQFKEQKLALYIKLDLGQPVAKIKQINKETGRSYSVVVQYKVLQLYPTSATVILKPEGNGKPIPMSQTDFDKAKFILL